MRIASLRVCADKITVELSAIEFCIYFDIVKGLRIIYTMDITQERKFWDSNFQAKVGANEIFFRWYDSLRISLFNVPKEHPSLEIGCGSGYFASGVGIDVAVDTSFFALDELRKEYGCHVVVADASNLPFKDGTFKRVYVNDVLHHLKAEGVLGESCDEINRILDRKGMFLISDRIPSLYNTIILFISCFGRRIFSLLPQRKKIRFSGSMVEPPMSEHDYEVICKDMEVVVRKRWKNCFVFWFYVLQQVINVTMPEAVGRGFAGFFVKRLIAIERYVSRMIKTDQCLVLRKQ